jgi:hypothetical protein
MPQVDVLKVLMSNSMPACQVLVGWGVCPGFWPGVCGSRFVARPRHPPVLKSDRIGGHGEGLVFPINLQGTKLPFELTKFGHETGQVRR